MTSLTRSPVALFAALAAIFITLVPASAMAGFEEEQKVRTASEILREIVEIPEKTIPPSLFDDAHGIAVIPGVIKVGFVLGGRRGRGILVVKDNSGWSDPVFVTITGGSVGWQIGASSTDVILVFKSEKSVDGVTRGKFTLGADAAVAAGPVGRTAQASTDVQLKAEIYSYSRSRGLFAGVAIEGAALKIDHTWNDDFYGAENTSPSEIFGGEYDAPEAARDFKLVIEEAREKARERTNGGE